MNCKRYSLETNIVHLNGGNIKVIGVVIEIGQVLSNTLPALTMSSICLGSETLGAALGLLLNPSDCMCT